MAARDIDWDAATREATDLLCRYIAIDTSNPPGNELAAAEFLASILRDNGIESEIYPISEGRANLSARLTGDGGKRPLVLLNHMDVVPVEPQFWQEAPFAGTVRDGVIWGRGALDMKSMGVMELMAMLLLRRNDVPLHRDVLFLACADEEMGGVCGIDWLDTNHPELFDAEYVINEGGYGSTEVFGIKQPLFTCAVGEKGPLWLRLIARGAPGHGSVPHPDNCLERLVRALAKIQRWQRPTVLLPEVRLMFERLQEAGVFRQELTERGLATAAQQSPLIRALVTNTVTNTVLHAGVKSNVIPATAKATLDCRLLPGQDPRCFIEEVRQVIDDPRIEIEQLLESHTPISPVDTELFAVIEQSVRETAPEALVVPSIAAGFTDSRAFRRRGVTAYGFVPCLLEPAELATVHGNDERIPIEKLGFGMRMLFDIVGRIAANT